MDRRTASRALATVAVGARLLDALEEWLRPARTSGERRSVGRLGRREVEQLEETARLMRQWDRQFGGGLRRRAVLGQLAEVVEALGEHQAEDIERRLYRVMADLAGTAAGMAWDSGMHRTAQDYYRLALRAAHAGGDRAFGANILAGMARQLLYPDQNRAGTTGSRLLDMARHDPRAGHAEAAAERIRTAVELRGSEAARSHALDWAGLAECSWPLGDVRTALEQTRRAVDVARLTQSAQVRKKLGRLHPYTTRHAANSEVSEARHRIREILST